MHTAMAVTAFGEPLEPRELSTPEVAAGEVLVQVTHCGVCGSDREIALGGVPFRDRLALPHVPGHDIAGVVSDRPCSSPLPRGWTR